MLKLTHVAHACFLIENDSEKLVIDPYDPSIGYEMPKLTANYALISHDHYDHNYMKCITKIPEVGTFKIGTIQSWHDDQNGALRGPNLIHIIESDGVRICHLGDLGQLLNDAQIAEIGEVDVLLVPVGGTYTIDAHGAQQVVRQLSPQVIIPMHYKTEQTNLDIAPVDEFLELMQADGVPVQAPSSNSLIYSPDLSGVYYI